MHRGYIKLYRKLLDSPVWKNPDLCRLFTYCLLKSSHTDFVSMVGCKEIPLKEGQFIFGRKVAAHETGISESKIYRYLKLLETMSILGIKTNNKCSVVTICKWDTYQATRTTDEQPVNNKRTTNEHVQEHNNSKNIKNTNTEQCDELYSIYPKKSGRQAAIKAIRSALKKTEFEMLKEAVTEFARSQEGREDKKYIKNPSTWFNQGCWDDERSTWDEWKIYNTPQPQTVRQGFHGGITDAEYKSQETGRNADGTLKF